MPKKEWAEFFDRFDTAMSKPRWYVGILSTAAFALQLLYVLVPLPQLRYEELAESYRNVYWILNNRLYDLLSHNFGWYKTLDVFYGVSGFSLRGAQYYKLMIAYVTFVSLAYISLKIWKQWRLAIVPYAAIALSPTLLYFAPIQAQYGIDLLYVPILIALGWYAWEDTSLLHTLAGILFGFLLGLSFFTYSVFYFSVPFLGALYFLELKRRKMRLTDAWKPIGSMLLGLTSLLCWFWPTLRDNDLLTFYVALIRGGGQTTIHDPNVMDFARNLWHMLQDFFGRADSYNFEHIVGDFSYLFPLLALGASAWLVFQGWQTILKYKAYIVLYGLFLSYNLYVIQYRNAPVSDSGMRRSTPVLMALYVLYGLAWYLLWHKKVVAKASQKLVVCLMLLLPLHHVLVYMPNLQSMSRASTYVYRLWLYDRGSSPQEVLQARLQKLKQEPLTLRCEELDPVAWYKECRYGETYAVLSLACHYSQRECQPIFGYDPISDDVVELSKELWDSYYWPH